MGNAAVIVSGDLLVYKNSSLQTLNFFDKSDGIATIAFGRAWRSGLPAVP